MVPPVARFAADVWVSFGAPVESGLFQILYSHWPTVAEPVNMASIRNQALSGNAAEVRTVPPAALVKINVPDVVARTFPRDAAEPTKLITRCCTVGAAVKKQYARTHTVVWVPIDVVQALNDVVEVADVAILFDKVPCAARVLS
jgi:hypothetical protein